MREIDGGSADSGDDAADTGHDRGSNQEAWAKVQARIARWDKLPASEQSGADAWGPNAEYWDEDEQAWRRPDSTPSAGDQEAAPASDATSVPEGPAESADGARGDHPYPVNTNDQADAAGQPDDDGRAPDAAGETNTELRQRVADLEAVTARLETHNAGLKSQNAELSNRVAKAESQNAQLSNRVAEAESQNAQLRAEVKAGNAQHDTDIADQRSENAELRGRLERLEQAQPDSPSAAIDGNTQNLAERADDKSGRARSRDLLMSNEAINFAAMTGIGVGTSVAPYWSHLGITVSWLGAAAAAIPLARKFREGKDATHRPKG